ncbi:MAG: DUF1566 domain-containing protein, partial [Desulfamplus sp.]|nr:DUF1566 domain-containing protein [Desulfamplus sp.]
QYVGLLEIEVWSGDSGESVDGISPPSGISTVDANDNPNTAPVYMGNIVKSGGAASLSGNMELSVNFPAYNKPVDIWILIALPDGRFYTANEAGSCSLYSSGSLDAVASGVSGIKTEKQILTPFAIGAANTAFEPWPVDGTWAAYWLVAPYSNGDIFQAIDNGDYQLGFYSFMVKNSNTPNNPDDNNGNNQIVATADPETGSKIALDKGVSVEFPKDFASGKIEVTLSKTSTPSSESDNSKITISDGYNIKLSNLDIIDGNIYITIPIDETLIPDGIDASQYNLYLAPELYNKDTGASLPVGIMISYNSESKSVTFDVSLKTLLSDSYKNSYKRNNNTFAALSDYDPRDISIGGLSTRIRWRMLNTTVCTNDLPYYLCFYTPEDNNINSIPANSVWKRNSDNITDPYNYSIDMLTAMMTAGSGLVDLVAPDGSRPFGDLAATDIKAYILNIGSTGGLTPMGGPILVSNSISEIEDWLAMRQTVAHEMVHFFQGPFYEAYSNSNRWFIEATAQYFTAKVACKDDSEKKENYAGKSNAYLSEYLSVPITTAAEGSYYALGHFLEWLDTKYSGTGSLVVDILSRRIKGSDDLLNLINRFASADSTFGDKLGKYIEEIIKTPEMTDGLGKDIKASMYSNSLKFLSTTTGVGSNEESVYGTRFTDTRTYRRITKPLGRLSAIYNSFDVKLPSGRDSLLVVNSIFNSKGTFRSLVYSHSGDYSKNSAYLNKTPVDDSATLPYNKPITIPYFGSEKAEGIKYVEHMVLNKDASEDSRPPVSIAYYLLVKPKITQLGQGETGGIIIVWTTEGYGTKEGVPASLISGYDVYDKNGVKLNKDKITLPKTPGSDLALEVESIEFNEDDPSSMSTTDYTVVIEDIYGNKWPEVKETTTCSRYQEVAGTKGSVLKDSETGLQWQRCSYGQTWNNSSKTCDGTATKMNANDAFNLTMDGGWRTPTTGELATLVYCDDNTFPVDKSWFWTSSWWEFCAGEQCDYIPYAMNYQESKMADIANMLPVRLVKSPY